MLAFNNPKQLGSSQARTKKRPWFPKGVFKIENQMFSLRFQLPGLNQRYGHLRG
jgi:hypothetical protein